MKHLQSSSKAIHYQSPEEIVQNVQDRVNKYTSKNSSKGFGTNTTQDPALEEMRNIMSGDAQRSRLYSSEETIDINTNFTRLNSGEYIPKYKNVIGNYGNEERLANQQTTGEKWTNGLYKMGAKTVNYATDALVGTVYGLYKGISEGSLDAVWNNDFSKYIDDLNTELDGTLPNYYTEAEKNMGVWDSMGTANFWANDFSNGLAFVGGNLLSGAITTVATGGFSLASTIPQLAIKAGGKTVTKQVFKNADNILKKAAKSSDDIAKKSGIEGAEQLEKLNKAFNTSDVDGMIAATNKKILRSTTLGKVGKGVDIAAFSVRTGTFEAGMEARHNFNESFETYVNNYREKNGHAPSYSEVAAFKEDATNTANWLFAGNMAILAPSNMIMFGKTAGIGLNTSKKYNSFVNKNLYGKGVNFTKKSGSITATALTPNKIQKNVARVKGIFGKAATEGLYEEGFQGVAGKTMQNYLEAKYNPNSVGRDVSVWSSLYESFGEQYGTKEGWKEMFIGSLIGGMGAPALISTTKGKPGEFFKSVGQNISQSGTQEANDILAKSYNDAFLGMQKKLSGQSALVHSANMQSELTQGKNLEGADTERTLDYNDALAVEAQSNFDYITIMEGQMSDEDIAEDYNFLVDNLDISEAAKKQGITQEEFAEYKTELKTKFAENLSSTRKAKNAAEALGLGSFVDSKGNTREASDVVARTIYEGIEALPIAKKIAEQLDQALGEDGMFSVLNMMNNLTTEQQNLTNEFIALKEDKIKKEKLSLALQRKLNNQASRTAEVSSRLQGTNKGALANSQKAVNARRAEQLKNAEALARINEEIAQADERLAEIKGEINVTAKVETVGLSNMYGETNEGLLGFDIEQALDKLDNIEKYTAQLRNSGKGRDAEVIGKLADDFLGYSTKARSLQALHRQMLDPTFFKKKKGKYLLSNILGEPYTMSEDLKSKLDENNERIIQVLAEKGMLKNAEAVTLKELVETNIVNNEELSDREKFRMESILKAQLLQLNILNTTLAAEEIENGTIVPKNEVKGGDSVKFSRELNEVLKDKTLTNAQQLDKLIHTIVQEVNKIFDIKGRDVTQKDITRIEKKYNVTIEKNLDGTYRVDSKIEKEAEEGDYKKVEDLVKRIKAGEKTDSQEDLQLKQNYPELSNSLLEEKELSENSEEALAELDIIKNPGFVVITEESLKQIEDLLAKQLTEEGLTEEELDMLEKLKMDFDRWTLAEGTVVNGVRLSDLIRRRLSYDKLSVETEDEIFSLDGLESLQLSDFENRGTDNYYFLAQSAVNATIIKEKEGIVIHNISAGELATVMGASINEQNPLPNTQVEFTLNTEDGTHNIIADVNQKGNLIFTEADIAIMNQNTKLILTPTNKELSTRYSILLQKDAEGNIRPVESDYHYQGEFIDSEAIYSLEKGETLRVVVDPKDEFNQKLLGDLTESVAPSKRKVTKETKTQLNANEEYQDALSVLQGFKEGTPQYLEAKATEEAIRAETIGNIVRKLTKNKIDAFTEENKIKLVNSMVIKLYKGEALVGVMKGVQGDGMLTAKDQQFELARRAIIQGNLAKIIDGSNDDITATEVEVVASDVFLGHPNYNFVEGEEGLSTTFKDISTNDSKKIMDVGYLEKGEITLKGETKDIDTTYLSKLGKKTGKQPIVVLDFAGKKVAYPANIKNKDKSAIVDEIETILDSKIPMIDKGIELDKRLALLGIDPNVRGNSLEYFSNTNNTFNTENIQNFLANVKNTPYIYSLEDWFGENLSLENIVLNQVQVNLNLKEPFHSPKFKMDFPNIDPPVPTKKQQEESNSKTKKKSVSSSLETQQAANALKNC